VARLLVTGGVGFIGYHVARALLERGDDVVVADDFSDRPYPVREKLRNEADLVADFPRARVVRACVTDRAAMTPLVGEADAVLHLAGLAGVRPSFGDPVRYARVNVEGTAVVQELARERGIERFLYAAAGPGGRPGRRPGVALRGQQAGRRADCVEHLPERPRDEVRRAPLLHGVRPPTATRDGDHPVHARGHRRPAHHALR
jgi:nucleoside-diphosphate-sugar epimerase